MSNILEMKGISKQFYGVQALNNVDFTVEKGEVHVLIGENGAGKSTLMKILSGAYQKDAGEIYFSGEKLDLTTPLDAQKKGISIIYQEFNSIPGLSVGENIFLGREPQKKSGLVDWNKLYKDASEILDSLQADINPKTLVKQLSVAEQQFVEIAKALSFGSKLIIMDEPSATLTPSELERLFDVIESLKAEHVSIIYISHHLDELFEIGDTVTILRDGEFISRDKVKDVDKNYVIKQMVGRELTESFPEREATPGEEVLKVEDLSRNNELKNISFNLRKGEILGIAGLVGSGRTELVRALYGADLKDSGKIELYGNKIEIESPRDSIEHGIGLLPEDRKQQGLVLEQPVKSNVTLARLEEVIGKYLIDADLEKEKVKKYISDLNIKTPSINTLAKSLSGGNQQKVVLAKWLFTNSDILIFDEPTRGIDIGAKFEIYLLMNELTKAGKSIIMISSELPEIIGMSDRVLVLHQGKITGEFSKDEVNQEKIMQSAAGEVNING